MYSIQHCSVAAICVGSNYENHSHCDAKSQPGDTVLRSRGPAIPMTLRGIACLELHSAHAGGGRFPASYKWCTTVLTDVLGFSSSITVRPFSQRALASVVSARNISCFV